VNISVSDGFSSDTLNFTLVVINTNDPPEINNSIDDFSFDEDTTDTSIDLTSVFIDIDIGDVLTYGYTGGVNISVNIFGNGTVQLTPDENWYGVESILFLANDSKADVADDMLITINPINDPPENNNFTYSVWPDDKNNVTFTANAGSDIEGDTLSYKWDFGDSKTDTGLSVSHSY